MTTIENLKEGKKAAKAVSTYSKRVSWNSKRNHNYKYIRSVF